jgi:hypothetical protein
MLSETTYTDYIAKSSLSTTKANLAGKKLLLILILHYSFCILNYSQQSGWHVISSGTTNALQSIHFTYTGIGYACGNSGTILKSLDEGITWNQVTIPTSVKLNDIFVFDHNVALAVDKSGIILRTTTGGESATLAENDYSPVTDFKLSQNYPNPFNPSTKISFTIPSVTLSRVEGSPVTLISYDVLGREVAALVNEELRAGKYEVEFYSHYGQDRNLSSGIYFYQLKASSFIQSKKMILIK